jgi:hypothetical protein
MLLPKPYMRTLTMCATFPADLIILELAFVIIIKEHK